jgi:hypothetical protein
MYAENTCAYKPRIACMKRSKTTTTLVTAHNKSKTHTTHSSLSEFHPGSSNLPSQESKMSDSVMKWRCKEYTYNMFTGQFLTIGAYLVSTSRDLNSMAIIPALVTSTPLLPRQALRYLSSFSFRWPPQK